MTLDTQIFYFLNSLAEQSPVFDSVVVFLASYLPYLLIALFLALVFFWHYPQWEKWELLIVVGAASLVARFGVTELIRFFYHRPRPFLTLPVHKLLPETSWSFPSGHATFFFALSTAVYLYNKKWGIGFFIATIFITVSRVISGIHYPSDIIGGAVIGIAVAYGTFRIAERVVHRYR